MAQWSLDALAQTRVAKIVSICRAEGRIGSDKIVCDHPCYLGRYRSVYDEPPQSSARQAKSPIHRALARILLRSGRRARVSRRRTRRTRQPCTRQGAGPDRRGHRRRGVPVLQHHVPRSLARGFRQPTPSVGSRADCRRPASEAPPPTTSRSDLRYGFRMFAKNPRCARTRDSPPAVVYLSLPAR